MYTFYLLHDQRGLLEVKARFLEPGWYLAELDQELIEQILLALEPEENWLEDMKDLPEIEELPMMSIVYKHVDGPRWFATQGKITHHFSETFRSLGHIISEGRWISTDLRPDQPDMVEPLDVIVQLHDGVDVQAWIQTYSHYGMQLKKRIGTRHAYYVVTKDPGKGQAARFLRDIKSDPDVIDAQWDHALTRREE